ncbi:hypothetical protein EBB05_05675 [Methylobacterium brachiatum]|nr:hypothetical protein EBB05_05675 [Methylobacterium brachiatum]
MCPLNLAGPIRLGGCRSNYRETTRAEGVSYDQLHRFVAAAGVWDEAALDQALVTEVGWLVGVLIVLEGAVFKA